jgi:hypothetical protein
MEKKKAERMEYVKAAYLVDWKETWRVALWVGEKDLRWAAWKVLKDAMMVEMLEGLKVDLKVVL